MAPAAAVQQALSRTQAAAEQHQVLLEQVAAFSSTAQGILQQVSLPQTAPGAAAAALTRLQQLVAELEALVTTAVTEAGGNTNSSCSSGRRSWTVWAIVSQPVDGGSSSSSSCRSKRRIAAEDLLQQLSSVQASLAPGAAGGGNLAAGQGVVGGSRSLRRVASMGSCPIIPVEEIEVGEPIGEGAEGVVYKARWLGTDVAAKVFFGDVAPATAGGAGGGDGAGGAGGGGGDGAGGAGGRLLLSEEQKTTLMQEVLIRSELTNHPNMVHLCGAVVDRYPPLLITELAEHGSLYELMAKARKQREGQAARARHAEYLHWKRRLEMLCNVACGMEFMHRRNRLHGDLRSPNLLVGADGRVKISDFGFCIALPHGSTFVEVAKITHPSWVAPEAVATRPYQLTKASDVYSFGMVMYELLTWQVPFGGATGAVRALLEGTWRPQVPPDDQLLGGPPPPGYIELMQDCWASDPTLRPNFTTIADRLRALRITEPPRRELQPLDDVSVATRHFMAFPSMASLVSRYIIPGSAALIGLSLGALLRSSISEGAEGRHTMSYLLRSKNGKYLSINHRYEPTLTNDKQCAAHWAKAPSYGSWSFEVQGRYLGGWPNPPFVRTAEHVAGFELWELIDMEDGTWAVRSHHGTYLSGQQDQFGVMLVKHCDCWEHWHLISA